MLERADWIGLPESDESGGRSTRGLAAEAAAAAAAEAWEPEGPEKGVGAGGGGGFCPGRCREGCGLLLLRGETSSSFSPERARPTSMEAGDWRCSCCSWVCGLACQNREATALNAREPIPIPQ